MKIDAYKDEDAKVDKHVFIGEVVTIEKSSDEDLDGHEEPVPPGS